MVISNSEPEIHLIVLQLHVLSPPQLGVYLGHLVPLLRHSDAGLTRLNVLTKLSTLYTGDKREISEIKDCLTPEQPRSCIYA